MSTLTLHAPAKLNLSLRVLRRRDDGFHDIDSLMVKLPALHDVLTIEPGSGFSFACDQPDLPADESNLVVAAVRAYEQATGRRCDCHMTLEKRIPHGAGLGGGSSDAAATLIALDELHDHSLGQSKLQSLASTLGSDVPFFLGGAAARCTGHGEIIEAAEAPAAMQVLLLKPWFEVRTPDAYARWQDAKPLPGIDECEQEIDGLSVVNDLERPVFGKHRFLAELKLWLLARHETRAAFLCGSGSAMAAVLHDGVDADALARCARHELDPGLWHWSGSTAT
jgi:4-diphosphocytidyl-2-C-methyl-D-erythritol kinase